MSVEKTVIFAADRLTGVTAKVSSKRPPLQNAYSLNLEPFQLCGQYTAKTKPGEIITMDCKADVIGRYVYVYIPKTNFLTICEVEVYGEGK